LEVVVAEVDHAVADLWGDYWGQGEQGEDVGTPRQTPYRLDKLPELFLLVVIRRDRR